MKDEYNILTDYPVNRIQDALYKKGCLDCTIKDNNINIPFIEIIPEVLWIDQDNLESTVIIQSNTDWNIVSVEESDNNLNFKKERIYGKTSMANSNSWVWKW